MYIRDKTGDGRQDILVIERPEAVRLLFSEKHSKILRKLAEKELSISEIARELDINPGSVHYHLKELEKQGLVRQVREEIKGGIVKKFYRSVAKRICIEGPDFDDVMKFDLDTPDRFIEGVIDTLGRLGYAADDARQDDAREMLMRFDKRMKELFRELHNSELDSGGQSSVMVRHASIFLLHMRAMRDPEFARINSMFTQLFNKVE